MMVKIVINSRVMSTVNINFIIAFVGCIWLVLVACLWNKIKLEESCVDGWDSWICAAGNVAGLCSSFLWSMCLIPQLYKNYERGTTEGLSLRWASANTIASLLNLNFVARITLPLYIQISAIYMPILELCILSQFVFLKNSTKIKRLAGIILLLLLAGILIVTLLWSTFNQFSGYMEWIAVVLWSIETYPQVWMNARKGTTEGQSAITVFISFLGKTTDFISMSCVAIPLQYQVMTYFSTSSAYINIVQYLYYKNQYMMSYIVLGMIICYTGVMVVKIGWLLALVTLLIFWGVLIIGYKIDSWLVDIDESDEENLCDDRESCSDMDTTVLLLDTGISTGSSGFDN